MRNVTASNFDKPWEYEQAKKQEKKKTKQQRKERNTKRTWEEKE